MNCTANGRDELAERRKDREVEKTARTLQIAIEEQGRRNLRFDHYHEICNGLGLSKTDTRLITEANPRIDQALWDHLDQHLKDQRFEAGTGPFFTVKKSKLIQKVNRRSTVTVRRDDLQPAIEYLRTISAVDYLPAIAGVTPLAGNRVRCPLPSHEDSNPSASFKDALWFCHACGRGGDLISLAEEVSGIPARGHDFIELSRWIASRLMTQADQVQAQLEARAA